MVLCELASADRSEVEPLNSMIRKQAASSLGRGTVEAFVLRAGGAGLLFLMHIVLGRTIGPEGYGTFSYVLALSMILAMVVPLGWPTALMRFIAQYIEQQRWGLLRGAVKRAYQVTFLFAMVAASVLFGISYWSHVSPEMAANLRYASLLLPLLASVALRRNALQGLQRVKASIIPEEIILPLLMIAGVYLFVVSTGAGALFVYAGVALLTFLLSNIWLLRSLPLESRAAKPEFQTRMWMTVALPMVFADFSQLAIGRTDVLILGATMDAGSVGLYSAASRIALLSTFVMTAVNTIGMPMLASAYYGGRLDQFRSIMCRAALWSTLGALPLFAAMIFFPQLLLGFFGPEFTQGALLLRLLALGQFINALTGLVGSALVMTGHQRTFALVVALVAAGNVLGLLVAIPTWGVVGAAVVTTTSVATLNICLLLLVRRIVLRRVEQ